MRFALTADHRDFFNKNNYIELEELLTQLLQASSRNMQNRPLPSVYRFRWKN